MSAGVLRAAGFALVRFSAMLALCALVGCPRGGVEKQAAHTQGSGMTANARALITNYGQGGASPWSNNLLANDTERLPSGRFMRRGGVRAADPSDRSIEQASALADEVGRLAVGMETGMGSDGGEGLDPFFVVAAGTQRCSALDERCIREFFGNALFPGALVTIEPLSEGTKWWSLVEADWGAGTPALARWRTLLGWFARRDFLDTAFVAIDVPQTYGGGLDGGCVAPRLLLGRTKDGAVVGLMGVVVRT